MNYKKVLILQTAFLGDVILTLPLVQVLKKDFPGSEIDFLCIPGTSGLLGNNPYINEVIEYDKKNSGMKGLLDLMKKLRGKKYDLIISPHRSFRSALISFFSSAGKTISFDRSSAGFLYDINVPYADNVHEIQRNLKLLTALGVAGNGIIKPELFPGINEKERVDELLMQNEITGEKKIIAIAPGSVWFTKRFPEEKFAILCDLLRQLDHKIVLIGGEADTGISKRILSMSDNKNIIDLTDRVSILESAEVIRRSALLITNDSAPLHIANSFGTAVIAIFGATVPSFGFYPYGKNDIVIETPGLSCRPCSIHGGNKCPIGTFECMLKIKEERIYESVRKILG